MSLLRVANPAERALGSNAAEVHAGAAPGQAGLRARLERRLLAALLQLRARARGEPWLILSICFVVLGIWLRTRRFFSSVIPLWGDEAHWTIQLLTTRLSRPSIRPIGFMAASKFLAEHFGPTEVTLRFLPWLGGVAGAIVAVPVARRLLRAPAARLLFVAIIAFHPLAIDLSKEFKPYAISLFLHLFCVWCAASYWDVGRLGSLVATMAASFVGVLFAQDVVFALPGLYLVLGLAAWRRRRFRQLLATAAGALVTIALLGVLYWLFWRYVGGAGSNRRVNGLSGAWWTLYDLFYTKKHHSESQLVWFARKFCELAGFSGMRRDTWGPLGPIAGSRLAVLSGIDQAIWTLLQILGLVCLCWQRRLRDLLLLVLPMILVVSFNLAKLWPLGAFRSDLFLLVYTGAVACAAVDVELGGQRAFRQLLPTALLVLAPLLLFERVWHRHKNGGGELLQGVDALVRLQGTNYSGPGELLVLDGYLCVVWRYYHDYHPGQRPYFRSLRHRFVKQCVRPWTQHALTRAEKTLQSRPERFWLLLARPPEMEAFATRVPHGYHLIARESIEQGQTLVVGLRHR